jgi:hypothetical protein
MSISLLGSVRTCKMDQAWADRLQSDRFFNPALQVCPMWNGMDTAGRDVCVDSYYTKNAGCNSAQDRVVVENGLRPQYSEYVSLSAMGYEGNLYDQNTMPAMEIANANANLKDVSNYPGYGNFGTQMSAKTLASCGGNAYATATGQMCCGSQRMGCGNTNYTNMSAQQAYAARGNQRIQEAYRSNSNKRCSGF